MLPHMQAGAGQHTPSGIPQYPSPHSRRQQEYHAYHHPAQPQQQHHHHYANYQHPMQYYSHGPPVPQYAQQRWQPSYPPPPHYMQHQPPPSMLPPQQLPYQPCSPMVVSSQPYTQSATPVTRQPPMPLPQPQQPLHSSHTSPSRSTQRSAPQQQTYTPAALPSPAPTPKQEQANPVVEQEPQISPAPAPSMRRQSSTAAIPAAPEYRMPYYPDLPWYSHPASPFPPRSRRRRRRRQMPDEGDDVTIVPMLEGDDETVVPTASIEAGVQEQVTDEVASEISTVAAPSEQETPATSQAPSENDFSQISDSSATVVAAVPSPKAAVRHVRKDTRSAIAVPNIPGISRPKPSPDKTENKSARVESTSSQAESTPAQAEPTLLVADDSVTPVDQTSETSSTTPAEPVRSAPKSWAEMARRNAPPTSSAGPQNGGMLSNGVSLPKSASLADALKQYSTESDAELSFLEPRGLVNTGNMCYMNAILQVLVFCVPFYDFLEQVRQRTVHSMKSDTPLLDAMIMFMKEFRVLATADSAGALRTMLTRQQLEQYGDPVTPEYVYDAIKHLDRFNSMRRGHQQDAEEFFGFLLEGLHDECVTVMRGQTAGASSESGVASPTSPVASPTTADGWFEVGPKQRAAITRTAGQQDAPSPITKIFGGHLRSELRVPGLQQSVTLEPYKPLQLDIGAPHVNNIVDALKGLTRTEALTGDFGGKSNSAKKQVFIDCLPSVLILHLKRFQYDNNLTGTQKIWKKVGYPLELEIPKEVFQPSKRGGLAAKGGPPNYRLISVVYHHGKSAAGGHYTVDVLRSDSREWIRMDDTFLRRIRPEDVAEGGSEEDPKLLAKALEQHKAEQDLLKQRNIYQGLDEADRGVEEERPWEEVNGAGGAGQGLGHRKGVSSVADTGTSTPNSSGGGGKKSPSSSGGRKEAVRDNKVAYILLYERIRA